MELTGYLDIVRRWWWLLVVAAVSAMAAGYAVASLLPRVYDAEVRVLVGPINTDLNTQRAAGQLAQTYAQLVASQRVTSAVIERFGLDVEPDRLARLMTATPNDVTRTVTVRLSWHDQESVAALANALAEELGQLAATTGRPEGVVQIIDPAVTPTNFSSPQVSLIVLLAMAAGTLGAFMLVMLIEYLRDAVRSPSEIRQLTSAPSLGTVPSRVGKRPDGVADYMRGGAIDAYRVLSARVEPALDESVQGVIVISGVTPIDRSGVVGVGLALGFAERGISAGLIDANGETAEATALLRLSRVPRLDALVGGGQIPTHQVRFPRPMQRLPEQVELTIVPAAADRAIANITQAQAVLDKMREVASVVVVTPPPIDRSADALLWARLADVILLVLPSGGVPRRSIVSAINTLQLLGLSLTGTVFVDRGPHRWLPGAPSAVAPQALPPYRRADPSRPRMAGGVRPGVPAGEPESRGPQSAR